MLVHKNTSNYFVDINVLKELGVFFSIPFNLFINKYLPVLSGNKTS